MRRRAAAVLGLALLTAGCTGPAANWTQPLSGLHACSVDPIIGVLTGTHEPRGTRAPGLRAVDVYGLEIDGSLRRLTETEHSTAAVVAPDARTVYALRSSGGIGAHALAAPGVVDRIDLQTGTTTVVAHIPAITGQSLSADGGHLALAHTDVRGRSAITVVDLHHLHTRALGLPPDASGARFSTVDQVAISPDGAAVAYSLARQTVRRQKTETVRVHTLGTDEDLVLYTAAAGDHVTELDWAPDGSAVIGVLSHTDTAAVEIPPQFRILRVDPRTAAVETTPGFGPEVSPAAADGRRLAGIVPQPSEAESHRYDLVTSEGANARLPLRRPDAAWGLSLARCAYE
jgi:hypothetical protein